MSNIYVLIADDESSQAKLFADAVRVALKAKHVGANVISFDKLEDMICAIPVRELDRKSILCVSDYVNVSATGAGRRVNLVEGLHRAHRVHSRAIESALWVVRTAAPDDVSVGDVASYTGRKPVVRLKDIDWDAEFVEQIADAAVRISIGGSTAEDAFGPESFRPPASWFAISLSFYIADIWLRSMLLRLASAVSSELEGRSLKRTVYSQVFPAGADLVKATKAIMLGEGAEGLVETPLQSIACVDNVCSVLQNKGALPAEFLPAADRRDVFAEWARGRIGELERSSRNSDVTQAAKDTLEWLRDFERLLRAMRETLAPKS